MRLPEFIKEESLYRSGELYRTSRTPREVAEGRLLLHQAPRGAAVGDVVPDFCTPCFKPFPGRPGWQICCSAFPAPSCYPQVCWM